MDTALEGKEPGCGSGWRDRPGTEGTAVGQPTQGREWCFIGLEAAGYPASRHGDFPLRRGVMFIIPNRNTKWVCTVLRELHLYLKINEVALAGFRQNGMAGQKHRYKQWRRK